MAKVKMKSNRSAKKRFKITAKGKIKRWHAGGSHYNTKKAKDLSLIHISEPTRPY